jgi:hypothetical protein
MNETEQMISKLNVLNGTSYMTQEESKELARLHDKATPLSEVEIDWLRRLYTRIYSLRP